MRKVNSQNISTKYDFNCLDVLSVSTNLKSNVGFIQLFFVSESFPTMLRDNQSIHHSQFCVKFLLLFDFFLIICMFGGLEAVFALRF